MSWAVGGNCVMDALYEQNRKTKNAGVGGGGGREGSNCFISGGGSVYAKYK